MQEREFRVVGGLVWCDDVLVAACQDEMGGKNEVGCFTGSPLLLSPTRT